MDNPRPDLQQLLAAGQRLVERAPAELADGLARTVRRAPEGRIDRIMGTPARRLILEGIFWQMPQYFDHRRAAGLNATVRWRITGRRDGEADTYDLVIADGRCRAVRGLSAPAATVTITMPATEFLRLATGNTDPMKSYLAGNTKLSGDVLIAARLLSLFRFPGARG